MKVKLDRSFSPINITLTIHSKRELELLWALLAGDTNNLGKIVNANERRLISNEIKPYNKDEFKFLFDLFDKLNDCWEFYGIEDKGSLFNPDDN